MESSHSSNMHAGVAWYCGLRGLFYAGLVSDNEDGRSFQKHSLPHHHLRITCGVLPHMSIFVAHCHCQCSVNTVGRLASEVFSELLSLHRVYQEIPRWSPCLPAYRGTDWPPSISVIPRCARRVRFTLYLQQHVPGNRP